MGAIGDALPVERVAGLVLDGAERGITARWEPARRRAAEAEGVTVDERIRAVTDQIAKELAAFGAITGGVAAVPFTGTATSLASSVAEIGWSTVRLADLILTIAALHGHDEASIDERRAWVLSVLAFGDGAARGFATLAGDVGKRFGGTAGQHLGPLALQAVNRALGKKVAKALARRRLTGALGRALPFGIGALVGAGSTYVGVRAVARQADRFFRQPPPQLQRLSVTPAS